MHNRSISGSRKSIFKEKEEDQEWRDDPEN